MASHDEIALVVSFTTLARYYLLSSSEGSGALIVDSPQANPPVIALRLGA